MHQIEFTLFILSGTTLEQVGVPRSASLPLLQHRSTVSFLFQLHVFMQRFMVAEDIRIALFTSMARFPFEI
jgi:hypothetical protein